MSRVAANRTTVTHVTAPDAPTTRSAAARERGTRVTIEQAMCGTSAGARIDMGGVL